MYGSVDRLRDGAFSLYAAWLCDEEAYVTELELVKFFMEEGKKMVAKYFFIGGDLIVELSLERVGEELQGLDSLDG